MLLDTVSQCNRGLDFAPLKSWPSALPAMVYKAYLLTDFRALPERRAHALESGNVSFADAFLSCHPNLSLPELARFYAAAKKVQHADALDSFAEITERAAGLKNSDALILVLEKIVQTGDEFQNWVSARGLATRELSILNSVADISEIAFLLQAIARLELTRSQGAVALERAIELFLMDKSVAEIWPGFASDGSPVLSSEAWLKHLETLRRPQSLQRENKARARVQSLPWPAYAQARWTRQGDHGQVEVKFHFSSSEDMKRKLEGLSKVQAHLEKETSL